MQQVIPSDWLGQLRSQLSSTEIARQAAQQHPPGPIFEKLWDVYNEKCGQVVDKINAQYGSSQALVEFMKCEVENSAAAHGLQIRPDYMDWGSRAHWMPKGQESIAVISMLRGVVEYNYIEMQDFVRRAIQKKNALSQSSQFNLT